MRKKYSSKDYEEALRHADFLIKKYKTTQLDKHEVVSESFENEVFIYSKMYDYIMLERRRDKRCLPLTYQCTNCKNLKNGNEFYIRTDYRSNFQYYIQPCIECHKAKHKLLYKPKTK